MRILIVRDNNPIKMFYRARNVVITLKSQTVKTYNEDDGTLLDEYSLLKKELQWVEDPEKDIIEIQVTLHVK